jgi:hypothetical protein
VKRRTMLTALAMASVFPALESCSGNQSGSLASQARAQTSGSSGSGSLVFDTTKYTTKTTTVTTGVGSQKVTYHYYESIPYVADPVDAKYQSLNVSVPVEVDGKAVDASGAPILLDISVGGYLSVAASDARGGPPPGGGGPPGAGAPPDGGAPPGGGGGGAGIRDLALAAGYVVVSPGCRGRDNVTSAGKYYGKAPAAIVDLKAAVRYVRSNKGRIPGNTDWIVPTGTSAGGALSALLGVSGDSPLYDSYLKALGAADVSDTVFASAAFCPYADLEHADMAYEWTFGSVTMPGGDTADRTISKELADAYPAYLNSLKLQGGNGFGTITADNLGEYMVTAFLQPSATRYLKNLSSSARASYLATNTWVTWSHDTATFSWDKFVAHIGRMKAAPVFDDLKLSSAATGLFGNESTDARHFTLYGLRKATGNASAQLDSDLPEKITLMNPMHFIGQKHASRSKNWWIRVGTSDLETSPTVAGNLATSLENLGDNVNALMYWDAGHGANEDPADFIAWIGKTTGYTK